MITIQANEECLAVLKESIDIFTLNVRSVGIKLYLVSRESLGGYVVYYQLTRYDYCYSYYDHSESMI